MPTRESQKQAKARRLHSQWHLFMENGYMLYTACSKCGKQDYCRGRYREYVKCEECHMEGLIYEYEEF